MLTPYEALSRPSTLCIYPEPILRPLAKVKSLAYLDRFWIKDYALQRGYDDAIVTSAEGFCLETSFANLFWRCGDCLFTPDSRLPFIVGITLGLVLQAAQQLGLSVTSVAAPWTAVPPSAQVYQCNCLSGIQPVAQVEECSYPRDEAFEKRLQAKYELLLT
jgi:4-amino-4-deoxychorismate lyase